VGTALLVGLIFAVVDKFNAQASNLAPIVIGLIVVAIGISFGGINGYAINPARDLAPRVFAVIAGFKNNGLTDGTSVWLPPVLGPIVGGILGGFAYDLFIGKALIQANAVVPPVGPAAKILPIPEKGANPQSLNSRKVSLCQNIS
jgi:glycerol uptake facilitator protein